MGEKPPAPEKTGAIKRLIDDVKLSRRSVTAMLLALAGGGAAAAASPPRVLQRAQIQPRRVPEAQLQELIPSVEPRTRFQVRRPDDMLLLDIQLNNLRVTGQAPNQRIQRVQAGRPAWIAVEHQAQHVAEEAFSVEDAAVPRQPESRLAGVSRVVFQMPEDIDQASWGLTALLEHCTIWPMRLSGLARPAPQGRPNTILRGELATLGQQRLDLASQVLLDSLATSDREALSAALPAAADRLARRMQQAASAGRELSDEELDSAVGEELNSALGSRAVRQTASGRQISSAALEAAAASAAIRSIDAVQAAPTRPSVQLNPNITAALLNTPRDPGETVTAIELPYRLIQTPLATAGWAHATGPVAHGGRTEIWHTRLGRRREDGVDDRASQPLRAIWSPDYPDGVTSFKKADGFPLWALTSQDRRNIVKLTAGFNERRRGGEAFTPQPAEAKRLMLSALGGALDLKGDWRARPQDVKTEGWTHRAANGRDYYVKVANAGWLFPFGHRVTEITLTERKFERRDGEWIAPLRQRTFIIVRQRERAFTGAGQRHGGRNLPFARIDCMTEVTPDLLLPSAQTAAFNDSEDDWRNAYVPTLPGPRPFRFEFIGFDGEGRRLPFSAPAVLVLDSHNYGSNVDALNALYAAETAEPLNRAPMGGATIQFAPRVLSGDEDGATNVPTSAIFFRGVARAGGDIPDDANFFPAVDKAEARLQQVKTLLGSDRDPQVRYSQRYLDHGFGGANEKAQAFLDIVAGTVGAVGPSASEPSDALGGLMAPDLTPSALSRKYGVLSGAAEGGEPAKTFLDGEFDVLDFLPDAKLLGAIDLKDVLKNVVLPAVGQALDVPKFTTVELPEAIEARMSIVQTDLKSAAPLFEAMPGSRFSLVAIARAERDPGVNPGNLSAQATVDAALDHFQINLFSCFILTFTKLSFFAEPGRKPKVDVDLDPDHGVMFGGPLEFVNKLRDIIPTNGFADPSPIKLQPTGLNASYSLTLPTVQVGVCSIQNISLGAGFNISFTGDAPSARFNFAERHAPFCITVSLFGGGGFFAMVIDSAGMKEVEASLEFGARAEINLGVASGGVYVKGGFYFHLERISPEDQRIYFEGFVELGGHLSILGLISVSLTFHLALAYEKNPPKAVLFGQASLTVEIEILFFSKSVSVKVERQFAGSEADPLFVDFIPDQDVWADYCEAFAEV